MYFLFFFIQITLQKTNSLKCRSADASEENVIDQNSVRCLKQQISQLEKAFDESRTNATNANVVRKLSGNK